MKRGEEVRSGIYLGRRGRRKLVGRMQEACGEAGQRGARPQENEHRSTPQSIQIRTDLEFERKRADEFEEKYKNAIRYKNE